ncbi:MAG: gamma-glutamyl-gamma-aminobutyrate hydrolase family protein [bacterium]
MTPGRPLVGITTRGVPVEMLVGVPAGLDHLLLEGVFTLYASALAAAGATPVLISREAPVDALVSRLDGLLMSGGEDVVPARYGGIETMHDTRHDPDRDDFEQALVDAALDQGIPILAICRGCQMLNVALGGTLVAHLEEVDGFSHAWGADHPSIVRHSVTLEPDAALVGALRFQLDDTCTLSVNSYHHQAVDRPGRGLRIVGRASDGTAEAIEMPGRDVYGVQWHPEMHAGVDPIFPWFVDIVRESTSTRESTVVPQRRVEFA